MGFANMSLGPNYNGLLKFVTDWMIDRQVAIWN